ncbi:OsmC family protein [Pseudomonas sp. R5(2019)]|uniref:OsmC family protein n=1 Tax=Pseudomonas sp. R5(2019) TaxID=2697566 RepID=UPI0014124D0C|nr:OsmC family protein [Pseudomonas sp. R5(2019)]NBA96318.1 OsmC family peroxiredoxin [Pseudomonas sp. R5(2019)]
MSESNVQATLAQVPYRVTLTDGVHEWLADVNQEQGGQDSGPSPHQLLLSALGGCTAITMSMYARRKEWPLEHIHVELAILKEEGKPVHTEIARSITLTGELTGEQRQRLLDIANACPVHKLLSGTVQIESRLA